MIFREDLFLHNCLQPGWKDIKCVPGEYPSFKEPECNCLGDTHIGPDKSLEVSWCAGDCRAEEKT